LEEEIFEEHEEFQASLENPSLKFRNFTFLCGFFDVTLMMMMMMMMIIIIIYYADIYHTIRVPPPTP
jgi:hypothetical protein